MKRVKEQGKEVGMRQVMICGGVVLAVLSLDVPAQSQAQGRKAFGTRTITHVGVVVQDVEAVGRAWADVFGVEVTPARERRGLKFPRDYRGDRSAYVRVRHVRFTNMTAELMQPMGGESPWRDFIAKYHEGIHHIALNVDDLEGHVQLLESKGGTRVVGETGGDYAFVDMMPQMGLVIELNKVEWPTPLGTNPGPPPTRGMQTPARIQVIPEDGEPWRKTYMELFDVPVNLPPPGTLGRVLQYPPDFTGDPKLASNREFYVPFDNFWVNLIQPFGGKSPWRDLLEKRQGGHLLTFNVDDVEAGVAALVKQGGHRTLGNEKAPYAYVDMPSLKITILLLQNPKAP